MSPDVPDALVGDAGRLRQVIVNLVGNGIKFSPAGEVILHVELAKVPGGADEVSLRFSVRDTGIGIAREKQAAIFRAFEQEDSSTSKRCGGTGLGLTIAARLVALMGGEIGVVSEQGRGSTFSFTARLGRQACAPIALDAQHPVLLRGLRVLIVDDNLLNRELMETWLRSRRMESTAVGDGATAMDALCDAVGAGQPYALALLDARMPDIDGLTLAASIRERSELSGTRIVLLTSGGRPGDRVQSNDVRVDASMLKPITEDELVETVNHLMSRAASDARSPARVTATLPPPEVALPPVSVLLAEDDELNLQFGRQLLMRRGHTVRTATNGREALELLLMLLDLHMPEIDGFEVIRAIRERERSTGEHLPVIALTARTRPEDRERALAAGMDDFLPKPIQVAKLWAAIERVLAARAGARPRGLIDPNVRLGA